VLAHGRWPVGRDGKSKDEKPAMHEHEKSDHPIVPTKSPNKGTGEEPRPAEAVEGRGWAKGNPSQGDTSRTQSRMTDVPSALERIGAARKLGSGGEPSSLRYPLLGMRLLLGPEAGAQCGNAARWDLCGGHRVTGVPTTNPPLSAEPSSLFIATQVSPWARAMSRKT